MTAHYFDPRTGERFPLDRPRWRSDAGSPLFISAGPGIGPADLDRGARGVWRYRAALPLPIARPITLGEGGTPLLDADWAGAGTRLKLEWFSATGSFKDRGAAVMLSALREQGIDAVIEDSSGNGGAAVAAYAAAGGLSATIFAPASTSPAKLRQARAHGARVELVEGPREASQTAAIAASEAGGGFYASHNWQAFFLEGTKTLAYELWEDRGFRAPDAIVLPVGAGSLLLGLARGFAELVAAGSIERAPRLYAAQPRNCSPIDAAFRAGAGAAAGTDAEAGAGGGADPDPDPWALAAERPVLPTIAEGTAIRTPVRLPELLVALRGSGGGTIAIPEDGIAGAHSELAARGLFAEPTSATALAGLRGLRAAGAIRDGEDVVVVLTGTGLKAAG